MLSQAWQEDGVLFGLEGELGNSPKFQEARRGAQYQLAGLIEGAVALKTEGSNPCAGGTSLVEILLLWFSAVVTAFGGAEGVMYAYNRAVRWAIGLAYGK